MGMDSSGAHRAGASRTSMDAKDVVGKATAVEFSVLMVQDVEKCRLAAICTFSGGHAGAPEVSGASKLLQLKTPGAVFDGNQPGLWKQVQAGLTRQGYQESISGRVLRLLAEEPTFDTA